MITDEEKRIKIAKACGWTARQDGTTYWRAVMPNGLDTFDKWISEENLWSMGIPDYFNDLNAMHEAEKTLTDKIARARYFDNLIKLTHGIESATSAARQRAEAFGLTLGLW